MKTQRLRVPAALATRPCVYKNLANPDAHRASQAPKADGFFRNAVQSDVDAAELFVFGGVRWGGGLGFGFGALDIFADEVQCLLNLFDARCLVDADGAYIA